LNEFDSLVEKLVCCCHQ